MGSASRKILFYLGLGFASIGGIVSFIFIAISTAFKQFADLGGIFTVMTLIPLCFLVAGIVIIIKCKQADKKEKEILRSGKRFKAKIYALQPNNSVTVNGRPVMDLVVRFFDDEWNIQEMIFQPNTLNFNNYQIGDTVDLCKYNGMFILDFNSVRSEKIPKEEYLLQNLTVAALRNPEYLSVKCKNCGATFNSIKGTAPTCPFCGVSLLKNPDNMYVSQ